MGLINGVRFQHSVVSDSSKKYLIQFFLVLMSEARRTFKDQLTNSPCFLEELSHIFVSVLQLD